jgi:hypothetical protein
MHNNLTQVRSKENNNLPELKNVLLTLEIIIRAKNKKNIIVIILKGCMNDNPINRIADDKELGEKFTAYHEFF